jgi:nitronate monooxygenase
MALTLRSFFTLRKAAALGEAYRQYYQAGKSVEWIDTIEPAGAIVRRLAPSLRR